MSLEEILYYEMTPLEAKAYKLCLLWEKTLDHELPGYYKNRLPRKGDPRKSLIFKYCYKLVRETLGLIPDEEYKLYITAQVQILKNLGDGTVHALIEPVCLVGEKAWKRWKFWKHRYDKALMQRNNLGDTSEIIASKPQIISEFEKTKEFLVNQLGENYVEKLPETIKNHDLIKWTAFSKVSPYWLILSPIIRRNFNNLEDTFSFDVEICKRSITPSIWAEFKNIFPTEFNKC